MNKGRMTTTRPIPYEVVQRVKELLKDKPRELALFVTLTNSAIRIGDLLKLKRENVRLVDGRIELFWCEEKTSKNRRIVLNDYASSILAAYLKLPHSTDFLFEGQRGKMNSAYTGVLIKKWCSEVGYEEPNTSNHSLRKTFCRTMIEKHKVPVYVVSEALNHSSERMTRCYIGMMDEQVSSMYRLVV